jgi:hypothetical protein
MLLEIVPKQAAIINVNKSLENGHRNWPRTTLKTTDLRKES